MAPESPNDDVRMTALASLSRLALRHALVVTACLLFVSTTAAAQAWTRPAGELYLKLAYGTATASDQFAFDGNLRPYADNVSGHAFFNESLYAYAEYGVLDELTVVLAAPYKRVFTRDESFRYRVRGLGDLTVGARWQFGRRLTFLPGRAALSINTLASLPTGYTRNHIPTVGNGQVDVTTTLDFGYSLWEIGVYMQAALGVRLRTSAYGLSRSIDCQPGQSRGCFIDSRPDLGDELIARIEAGYQPTDWLLVQSLNELLVSVAPPEVGFSVREPIPTRRRQLKTGLGLGFFPLRELGFSVQGFLTPWGRNTVRSVDVFIGIETALDLRRL